MVPSFKGKIRLVSYPISPLFKRSNTKEKALGTPIIFTNVGIEPRKGIETLLKAAKLIPRKLKIVIKGSIRDPLYMQSLQELVKHYGLEKIHDIRFITSFVNYDQLVDYYNSSTLFVFPSREDCLGVTVLEALHCGLPVVATNVGGVPDMLEHGENSLLVPPDDPHKMAQAILNLLDNPELRTKLIENGCRVLENRFYTGRLTLEQAFEQSFLCAP
jgi:glycosyltransferase involved in cell wall biosynthesis